MYFTFMENSTETILETPLILCSFDRETEIMGSEREVIKGETSIYRSTANEYGAKYSDVLTFTYALIKKDETAFTELEQRKLEKWLTSPKTSRYLQLYDCNGFQKTIYCGTFISTQWVTFAGGLAGIKFTFQCNSPYAWQYHTLHYEHLSGSQILTFHIYSDEAEEFVYPSLHLLPHSSLKEVPVTVKNITDQGQVLHMNLLDENPVYLDCKTGHLSDGTTNGVIYFPDIGWEDAGANYLPRFYPGENQLEITIADDSTLELDIAYASPKKVIGGWMNHQ